MSRGLASLRVDPCNELCWPRPDRRRECAMDQQPRNVSWGLPLIYGSQQEVRPFLRALGLREQQQGSEVVAPTDRTNSRLAPERQRPEQVTRPGNGGPIPRPMRQPVRQQTLLWRGRTIVSSWFSPCSPTSIGPCVSGWHAAWLSCCAARRARKSSTGIPVRWRWPLLDGRNLWDGTRSPAA